MFIVFADFCVTYVLVLQPAFIWRQAVGLWRAMQCA